jgi:uncharacterized protein
MNAETIIQKLDLQPHPEGGWYRETYRCDEGVAADAISGRYGADKTHSTAIYFLITADNCSRMHRLQSDEIFHFYCGDPVKILRLYPDGQGDRQILGADLAAGQHPQCVVPRNVWQGLSVLPGEGWTLLGTTVSPGFDFADIEYGSRNALLTQYPGYRQDIIDLTND